MYLFLAVLSSIDLVLSSITMPKMASLFLTGRVQRLSGPAVPYPCSVSHESAVRLAMAFDHVVTICHPLRHASVLPGPTVTTVTKIWLAALTRGFVFFFPLPFILKQLSYCQTHTVTHFFCLPQDIMKLSCTDTTVSSSSRSWTLTLSSQASPVSSFWGQCWSCPLGGQHSSLSTPASPISVLCWSSMCPSSGSRWYTDWMAPLPFSVWLRLTSIYLLLPPMVNPIVYGAKTKEIHSQGLHTFLQDGRWAG